MTESFSDHHVVLSSLTVDSPRIKQPMLLKVELMDHQKAAIYGMDYLERKKTIMVDNVTHYGPSPRRFILQTSTGILSDHVGAGKTYDCLGLIAHRLEPDTKTVPFLASHRMILSEVIDTNQSKTGENYHPTNLILIPHQLGTQWMTSIANTGLTAYHCHSKKTLEGLDLANNYNVILISSTRWKQFIDRFPGTKFARLFVDEADSINLTSMGELANYRFIWLVTATPDNLRFHNRYTKLSLFDQQAVWVNRVIRVENEKQFIQHSLNLPKINRVLIHCLTPPELSVIRKFIPGSVMQMVNGGDLEGAIRSLNCSVQSGTNLIKALTNRMTDQISDLKMEVGCELKKKYRSEIKKQEQVELVAGLNNKIARIENRLAELEKNILDRENGICNLCFGEVEKPTMVNCCNNIFCFDCILDTCSQSHRCPICRQPVYQGSLTLIEPKAEIKDDYERLDKVDALIRLVKKKPTGKFILFSKYDQTFARIIKKARTDGISFGTPKGSNAQVNRMVKRFEQGKIQLLMLNSKQFGAGLNLHMATDIVIFHRFNYQKEDQLIGRGQRPGRKEPLTVYYLLHNNEGRFEQDDQIVDYGYLDWLDKQAEQKQYEQKQIYHRLVDPIERLEKIVEDMDNNSNVGTTDESDTAIQPTQLVRTKTVRKRRYPKRNRKLAELIRLE